MPRITKDGVDVTVSQAEVDAMQAALRDPIEEQRKWAEMERLDFAHAAAIKGYITYDEAASWLTGNGLPTKVQAVIDQLPPEQRWPVMLDICARPTIRRNSPIMPALAVEFGVDDAGLDEIFGISA